MALHRVADNGRRLARAHFVSLADLPLINQPEQVFGTSDDNFVRQTGRRQRVDERVRGRG
eukprot:421183-Hanusia_phi.AAC.1